MTNKGDDMTGAPGTGKDWTAYAREFLRRDDYDFWFVRERESLDAAIPVFTREQWLAARDPLAMLALLQDIVPDEELRAFCCACCRRMSLTCNATAPVMVDALWIAEVFAKGQVAPAELYAAHQNIAQEAQEAGDRFAYVNMKLGDSTDELDYMYAAEDYEFAQALADATDGDIGSAASGCIAHVSEFVRIRSTLASKEHGPAARASEESAQADMIRERWTYPAESAARLLEIRRYREFRIALAGQRHLAGEQWRIMTLFAARLEGLDHARLRQLCQEQISALSAMLPAATVQHILLNDLMRVLGITTLHAGAWGPPERALSRPQLIALPNKQIGELMAEHLQAEPPGTSERWCCSLFFDQLTAVALARIGAPPAVAVWPMTADDLGASFRQQLSTLRALPPKRWF